MYRKGFYKLVIKVIRLLTQGASVLPFFYTPILLSLTLQNKPLRKFYVHTLHFLCIFAQISTPPSIAISGKIPTFVATLRIGSYAEVRLLNVKGTDWLKGHGAGNVENLVARFYLS